MSTMALAASSAARRVWTSRRLAPVVAGLLLSCALAACGERKPPVNMPGKPRHTVEHDDTSDGPSPSEMYTSTVGQIGYSFSVQLFPLGADLDTAVHAIESNSKIWSLVKTTYQGFPARDLRIAAYLEGQRVVLFERMVLVPRALVDLLYRPVSPDLRSPPAAGRAFLASLKIP